MRRALRTAQIILAYLTWMYGAFTVGARLLPWYYLPFAYLPLAWTHRDAVTKRK